MQAAALLDQPRHVERKFDAAGFARDLKAAVQRSGLSDRQAGHQAGVSRATMSRALAGDDYISHENVLRLRAWMDEAPAPAVAS